MIDSWFTDLFTKESSNQSSEPEESTKYLALFTEIFQIIPCVMDRDWLSTRWTILYLVDSILH